MKTPSPSRRRGLTLIEVLTTVLVVLFLFVLLAPFHESRSKRFRFNCLNNLKNVGLAFRIFANDNGGKWPMELSVTNGGSSEYVFAPGDFWRHWLVLSNELSTPKILLCAADTARLNPQPNTSPYPIAAMSQLTNDLFLSYFLGLNAGTNQPQAILAGDRNLTTNDVAVGPGRLVLTAGQRLGFTKELHNQAGNILLGDGHVEQVTSGRLAVSWDDARKSSGLATNVWLVP